MDEEEVVCVCEVREDVEWDVVVDFVDDVEADVGLDVESSSEL